MNQPFEAALDEVMQDLIVSHNFDYAKEALAAAHNAEFIGAEGYYLNVRRVIDDLAKNAAHSFDIDFMALNEAGIETNKRLAAINKLNSPEKETTS